MRHDCIKTHLFDPTTCKPNIITVMTTAVKYMQEHYR